MVTFLYEPNGHNCFAGGAGGGIDGQNRFVVVLFFIEFIITPQIFC
jgi:hypothetical protein